MSAGMGDNFVGVVRFVCHEKDGAVGLVGNCKFEVGVAGSGVFNAAEPEAGAIAFDREVLVDQDGSSMGYESLGNGGGAVGDVMVAEDGVAEGGGEGGDDLGAAVKSVVAGDEGEGAVGDEVAGEEDEVGGQSIDVMDDALEEEGLSVLVEVDVADLDDAVTVERIREVGNGDGALDDVDLVTRDLAGVES